MQRNNQTVFTFITKRHAFTFLKKENNNFKTNTNLKPYTLQVKKYTSEILQVAGK